MSQSDPTNHPGSGQGSAHTIAELREMEARATCAPWSRLDEYIDCDNGPLPIASGWYEHMTMEGGQHHDAAVANAALIVALRNALPSLLDHIEAAETELAEIKVSMTYRHSLIGRTQTSATLETPDAG